MIHVVAFQAIVFFFACVWCGVSAIVFMIIGNSAIEQNLTTASIYFLMLSVLNVLVVVLQRLSLELGKRSERASGKEKLDG